MSERPRSERWGRTPVWAFGYCVLLAVAASIPGAVRADLAAPAAPAAPVVSQPASPALSPSPSSSGSPSAALPTATAAGVASAAGELGQADALEPLVTEPISILGEQVEPGSLARLVLRSSQSFSGTRVETHVAILHGRAPGPRVCIIAGIHGDEVNGVEVVRRALTVLSPITLRGTVIAVPIANPSAFRRGSRYLPDRRDLNRYFPGRPDGSSASRIAQSLFDNVIRECDAVVDLHTGSFHRANLHQLRANLADAKTADLAAAFGAAIVVNSAGRPGTLRRAATDAGIPAITVEAGESARFDKQHVDQALRGILRLLESKNMILPGTSGSRKAVTAYLRTRWVRCDQGGILVSRVGLGDEVEAGEILGTISDPLSDEVAEVTSPLTGRVIGMALDQVVMPGFAAYHIGFKPRPLRNENEPEHESAEPASEGEGGDDAEGMDLEERPE